MRSFKFLIISFLFSIQLFGQSIIELNKKSDSLNLFLDEINLQINNLNDKKIEIQRQLNVINYKKNQLEFDNDLIDGLAVTLKMEGILRDKPNITGNEIITIPIGDTVLIYNNYEKPYFKASYKDKVGFISYSSLNKDSKVESLINKNLEEKNPKLAQLTKEFGSFYANKIINGEYWIGMTDKMAISSLGLPDDINKSTGSWGVHEQWVYSKKGIYLYFENGKLTSTQN